MDNMEENSRSTEQDRVANPVEETVSTTVEPALSENKGNGKKEKKPRKKRMHRHRETACWAAHWQRSWHLS